MNSELTSDSINIMEVTFPSKFDELGSLSSFLHCSSSDIEFSVEQLHNHYPEMASNYDPTKDVTSAEEFITATFLSLSSFPDLEVKNQICLVETLTDLCKEVVRMMADSSGSTFLTSSASNCHSRLLFLYQHMCSIAESIAKSQSGYLPSECAAGTNAGQTKSKKTKKNAHGDGVAWQVLRSDSISVLLDFIRLPLRSMFPMGIVPENFIRCTWTYALKLLQDRPVGVYGTGHKEAAVRANLTQILTSAVQHMSIDSHSAFVTAALDSILHAEHMGLAVAETLGLIRTSHAGTGRLLMTELVNDLSRMNMQSLAGNSVKNVALFIETYGKVSPESFIEMFPTMVLQLDSPVFQIRSSILHAFGYVVEYAHGVINKNSASSCAQSVNEDAAADASANDDAVAAETSSPQNAATVIRFRDSVLDMMVERTHDSSPYTRAALLKIWIRLLEKNAIPVQRFVSVADIAVDRLVDKNAAVRRNAAALAGHLLQENPFAGQLDFCVFNAQKTALEKSLDERITELREATATAMASDLNEITSGLKGVALSNINEGDEIDVEDGDNAAATDAADAEKQAADSYSREMKKALEENALEEFLASPTVQEDSAVIEIRAKLDYCTAALGLIRAVEEAVNRIAAMLQSRVASDVIEALKFFSTAVCFRITGALEKFKSSFSLIWHQDASIKLELISSFRSIYLTNGGVDEQHEYLTDDEITINLLHLVRNCDAAELTSMEQIVGELFKTQQVQATVINSIIAHLQRAADATPEYGLRKDAGACIRLLSMVAHSDGGVLDADTVALVVKAALPAGGGVGDADGAARVGVDLSAVGAAARCFQMMPSAVSRCFGEGYAKVCSSSLQKALDGAVKGFCDVVLGKSAIASGTVNDWFAVCEEIVHALFHTQMHPDRIMSLLIRKLYSQVSQLSDTVALSLIRLVFVVGQTALNSLVFTESIAAYAKKYTPQAATTRSKGKAAANTAAAAAAARTERDSICSVASELTVEGELEPAADDTGVDAMEEEMGAAAAADADHERMLNHIIEHEIVIRNLIGKFMPLISFIAANEGGKYDAAPVLRQTAVLSLCRAMSVSVSVCESSLPLLFTVLEREVHNAAIRTTIVIALGDLSFRFPNSVEPWTERMYARLRDADVTVRYNALMVITHLVLNDMIKVKGQVCHVAMSLNDDCESIRELAKLFFIKLSERSNNPVYNLLGDIISIFSQDSASETAAAADASAIDTGVGVGAVESEGGECIARAVTSKSTQGLALSVEQFQSTMQFMLSFVQKDKQADTLLERLLVRLAAATSLRQRRNLAFCIAQLTVTEKGVRKMVEHIKNIKDALYDSEIFESFKSALSRAKKSNVRGAGAETKTAMEEFEQLLAAIHSRAHGEQADVPSTAGDEDDPRATAEAGDDDSVLLRSALKKPAAANNKKKKTASSAVRSKKPPQRKKKDLVDSDSDESSADDDDDDVGEDESVSTANDDEGEVSDAENRPKRGNSASSRHSRRGGTKASSAAAAAVAVNSKATANRGNATRRLIVADDYDDEEAEFM